ncbi:nucleotidyltransferase family protein [Sphingobacterium multivorum]|uniref:nucleotidyltransferase family protein n=1 Tax=Sphingobacterium multivorum TaxID=28454 RepID=UPI0028AD9261|nr:sugar phosphate nucleotidyltransferase [Sphingobacterium multivorum]
MQLEEMEFAIIAAGEGSRLRKEGFNLPKPLLPLHGVPLIERLIRVFVKEGAQRVHVIINKQSPELKLFLEKTTFELPIVLIEEDTASSLHSFALLVKNNPDWSSCCLTTTDTVFRPHEFHAYLKAFQQHQQADAFMAVTPFVDDESPLYVNTNSQLRVEAFLDTATAKTKYVSGGIYCFRQAAMDCALSSVEAGNSRMRNFQRALLENDLQVEAFVFEKVVDIDHLKDRVVAEQFLSEEVS